MCITSPSRHSAVSTLPFAMIAIDSLLQTLQGVHNCTSACRCTCETVMKCSPFVLSTFLNCKKCQIIKKKKKKVFHYGKEKAFH